MAIDGDDAAQRFARALLTDVARYNRAKLSTGGDPQVVLAAELAEARELFRARAEPALHTIFERELLAFDFFGAPATARTPAVAALAVAVAAVLAGAAYRLLSR